MENVREEFRRELEAKTIMLHHTALARGYKSRKTPDRISYYSGKFGEGYTVVSANPRSNRYHIVTYYTRAK